MISRRIALCLILAATASGCFDVHTEDPGSRPWVIDDFEDENAYPTDPRFGRWECATFPPRENPTPTCGVVATRRGDNWRSLSLRLQASVADPLDGNRSFGGAYLATNAVSSQDFTHYDELSFKVALDSEGPVLPTAARLEVDLGCSHAPTLDGGEDKDYRLMQMTLIGDLSPDRQALPLSGFGPGFDVKTGHQGGNASCLERVDLIQFTLSPQLDDGGSAQLELIIDDINIQ